MAHLESILTEIVGKEYVSSELCDRLVYSKDYSVEGIADDYTPDIIVKPGNTDEAVQIVEAAGKLKIPSSTRPL